MPIKITGFDPDEFEKPEPESRSRPVRRSSPESTPTPAPQPREVRKSLDADTAEHLRIKYGLTNVKFTEVAPKKAKEGLKSYKSGATHKGTGPRLKAGPLETPTVAGAEGSAASAEPADAPADDSVEPEGNAGSPSDDEA